MSKKVALMCGHGTQTNGVWDPGTTYAGYSEAALMLPITKAAVKELRARGVTVITDSDAGNKKNMILSVAESNKNGCNVYISVHCDWYKAGSGVYPLYVSTEGKKLATALNAAISKGMGMKSRGICKRTDLYELNATDAYACVLETGSIKADLKILRDDYTKYGKCIAEGICNYLGIKTAASSNTKTTKPVESPQVLYRVRKTWSDSKSQIGAYANLDNAKKACDEHPGYSVYGENGKVVYTSKSETAAKAPAPAKTTTKTTTTPKTTTKADLIVAGARAYSWPYGTDEKKWAYKTGSAVSAYKTGLKEYMKKTTKIAQSDCGYFISTLIRRAGLSSSFVCLKSANAAFPAVPSTMKIVHQGKKIPSDTLQPGDVIRYKKTNGSQHAMVYLGSGKISEAGRKIRFPVIRKDTGKYNASNVKFSTLQVIRAK